MTYRHRFLAISLLDTCIIVFAVSIAYYLRFEFRIADEYLSSYKYLIVAEVILGLLILHWQKVYRPVWQYVSIRELSTMIYAITFLQSMLFVMYMMVSPYFPQLLIPRSIFFISWAFMILGIGGSRVLWRLYRNSSNTKMKPYHRRALIIGAGSAGVMVAKELFNASENQLFPIAFIDDDPFKQNLMVMGLPVLGPRGKIPEIVATHKIEDMIIAMPSATKSEIADIIEICNQTKANIKILPSVCNLLNGKESIKMIREVKIEDLLGREPVLVDLTGISCFIQDDIILVTGAGGSIGSELCRQLARFHPKQLLLIDHDEYNLFLIEMELRKQYPHLQLEAFIADIRDQNRIKSIFQTYRPSIVYHAAAHKHVPLMEINPAEAVKNNIIGTKNVAEAAHLYGASNFVLISTDKAVNPTSVMGATKRVAELLIQGLDRISETVFVAVRFGNVLGSRGSVVPLFQQQIEAGGPLTVTHPEMIRFFMTIPEAVQLVIQASVLAEGGEIFILDMGKPVKISTLAKNLIRLTGLEPEKDIQIVYTGIRPGEKLYEEILTNEEGLTATKHNRIFVGKPMDINLEQLLYQIDHLHQLVSSSGPEQYLHSLVREMLKGIVLSYQYENTYLKETQVEISFEKMKEQNPVAVLLSEV